MIQINQQRLRSLVAKVLLHTIDFNDATQTQPNQPLGLYAFQDRLPVNKLLQPHLDVYEQVHVRRLHKGNQFYPLTNHGM